MFNWQEFESKIFKYLRRRYSDDGHIRFIKEGSNDSTKLDIKIIGKYDGEIYIEVKSPLSQAGQFVIEEIRRQYKFKENHRNKEATVLQQKLIDYINKTVKVEAVKQSAIIIPYLNEDTADLIREHYTSKGARYFVTGTLKTSNAIAIIPVRCINEAFKLQINLRRKKSGTRSLPKKDFNIGKSLAKQKLKDLSVKLLDLTFKKGKLIFITNCARKIETKLLYFTPPNDIYFLSQGGNYSNFEIKIRSSTNNINIIYTLEYNGLIDSLWEEEFVDDLNKL